MCVCAKAVCLEGGVGAVSDDSKILFRDLKRVRFRMLEITLAENDFSVGADWILCPIFRTREETASVCHCARSVCLCFFDGRKAEVANVTKQQFSVGLIFLCCTCRKWCRNRLNRLNLPNAALNHP